MEGKSTFMIISSTGEKNLLKTIGISKNVVFDFEKHEMERFHDWENQFINQVPMSSKLTSAIAINLHSISLHP
jgi:hypothetical protein